MLLLLLLLAEVVVQQLLSSRSRWFWPCCGPFDSRSEEFIRPEGGLLNGKGGGDRRVLVDEDPAGLEAIAMEGILETERMKIFLFVVIRA